MDAPRPTTTICRAEWTTVTAAGIRRPFTAASTETTGGLQRRNAHQPNPPITPAAASTTVAVVLLARSHALREASESRESWGFRLPHFVKVRTRRAKRDCSTRTLLNNSAG